MNHNTEHSASTARGENSRMKISLARGTETWFDVDGITIHFWGSNWTGREIVTVRNGGEAHVVSDVRSLRFKTLHEFEHKGRRYALDFSIGLGKAEVQLFREDKLIDSDLVDNSGIRINPETGRLDWGHAMKKLVLPLVAGIIVGVTFGYGVGVVLK